MIPPPDKDVFAALLFGCCLQWEYDESLTARERDELEKRIHASFLWFANTFFPQVEYTVNWRVTF